VAAEPPFISFLPSSVYGPQSTIFSTATTPFLTMASFKLPALQEATDRWGPPTQDTSASSVLPEEFREIPFAPFAKGDKIGRFADWNASSGTQQDGGRGGGAGGDDRNAQSRGAAAGLRGSAPGQGGGRRGDGNQSYGAGASTFTYFHGNDEASFSMVDNTRSTTAKRGGGLSNMNRGGRGASNRGGAARGGLNSGMGRNGAMGGSGGRGMRGGMQRGGMSMRGGRRGGFRDWERPQRTRDPSVLVGPDWEQEEEIEFSRLSKLRLDVNAGEDISSYGTLYEYDRTYDRISSVRFEKPLQPMDRVRYNITTSDDPILQDMASQPAQPLTEESVGTPCRIFTTDSILALLMCAPRTVYPWDIVITRDSSGNIWMDKRDGGAFDFVTVNENASDPPAELEQKDGEVNKDKAAQLNTPGNLSLEATYINQNFAFQVVSEGKKHQMSNGSNPFYDESTEKEQLASCGYKYRKFDLSTPSDDVSLIVRTEIDAILMPTTKGQPKQYITIKTLNEFDSRVQGAGNAPDWRSKLDSQRGAVVATEMKNNGAKLARFAVQSVLANADNMKMGYISRANARDASRHVILGTQSYKPREFAAQINVNFANGWGIVRTIADLVRKVKEGQEEQSAAKFVLAKDPNKAIIRLYRVPLNWPAEDEDDGAEGVADLAL
jgi:translation initiation factor 3 subunit D